jgi:hypothetical protein
MIEGTSSGTVQIDDAQLDAYAGRLKGAVVLITGVYRYVDAFSHVSYTSLMVLLCRRGKRYWT